mmetsp:Transcript_1860/g.5650  ORF Transcript_1860/g.5650 Transcript_1860/m.5650 type:complete len:224 (+) Transcript_1860:462-1133(+)
MLKTIPLASKTGKSSNGEDIAATAASTARFGPFPVPMPISADPASFMMVLTSAKSTFIKPGFTMISEMPIMPCLRISSATRNASVTGVDAGTIDKSLSFEITMMVSHSFSSSSMPSIACRIRRRPSNPNGFVTTPTVRAPEALAHAATTGAAPVPVPPPMPAVTKTMSAPLTTSAIAFVDSTAARRPTSGDPPAPRPLVTSVPMFMRCRHRFKLSACASVLTT